MDNIFLPPSGTMRVIFLYVGQGESTLLLVPNGPAHIPVLIDANRDAKNSDFDTAAFLKGHVLPESLIFINTHPHADHLRGLDAIHEAVGVAEIWHSWHVPHKDNRAEYDKMLDVITDIGKESEFYLRGTRDQDCVHTTSDECSKVTRKLGDAEYQVFAPAEYVCEEIEGEDEDSRRARIHEQCWVVKISYAGKSLLITGDSDRKAWEEHIMPYHGDHVGSTVLSASHHGSKSFFKVSEEEPFLDHMEAICPEYLVVSAPKESPHEHPHEDAMELYGQYVTREQTFVLGDTEQSLVLDISPTGTIEFKWLTMEEEIGKNWQSNPTNSYQNQFVPSIPGGGWCVM